MWLPRGHPLAPDDVVESYRWIGDAFASALAELGIAARALDISTARAGWGDSNPAEVVASRACFGGLSPYEVVTDDGRKVVGLAQVRRPTGTLLQVGVVLRFDARLMAELLERGGVDAEDVAAVLGRRVAGVLELQPELEARAMVDVFERHLAERADATWSDGLLEESERYSWCRISRVRKHEDIATSP